MKIRSIFAALYLVLSLCYSVLVSAQGTATLRVAAMPGFPDLPTDSAYEGQSYTFDLLIVNNSNINISGGMVFNMRVDSIVTTFLSNPTLGILAGDSATLTVTQYNFTQPQFKMGNNIVVVWPVANGFIVPVDSLITNVHFIPLSSLGSIDLKEPAFKLYPVPARQTLQLDLLTETRVEYVRIYDVSGQLVKEIPFTSQDHIDISFLAPGMYTLELASKGNSTRKKFIAVQ